MARSGYTQFGFSLIVKAQRDAKFPALSKDVSNGSAITALGSVAIYRRAAAFGQERALNRVTVFTERLIENIAL
jgi:hypothetical protein